MVINITKLKKLAHNFNEISEISYRKGKGNGAEAEGKNKVLHFLNI